MVTAARLSPDGSIIATSDEDGLVRLYDAKFKPIGALKGHFGPINDLAWSANSRTLATAGADKLCILWDTKQFKMREALRGHTHEVTTVSFNYKGTVLITASIDQTARLWSAETGECLYLFSAHSEVITKTNFTHDGTMVCTASADGLVRIWDVPTGLCLKTVDSWSKIATYASFTPNSAYIVITTSDGYTRIWDYIGRTCAKEYKGAEDNHTRSVCVLKDTIYIAGPETISVYDLQSTEQIGSIPFEAYTIESHGESLLVGGPEGAKWVDMLSSRN